MEEFMENFGGYIVIGLLVLLFGLGAFTFLTSKNQNERIAYLEQCCNDVNEQLANASAPSITMVQVQDEVKKMIEEALANNNSELSEASTKQVEEAVKKAMQEAEDDIYVKVYEQVVSDLTTTSMTEEEEEKKEDTEEKKEEEKKEEEKKEDKTEQKPSTTTQRRTNKSSSSTTAQTPTPTPTPTPAPAPDPDDPHFKVDGGESIQ